MDRLPGIRYGADIHCGDGGGGSGVTCKHMSGWIYALDQVDAWGIRMHLFADAYVYDEIEHGAVVTVGSNRTILAPGEIQDLSIAGKVVTITGTDREGVLLNGVQIKKDQSHIAR